MKLLFAGKMNRYQIIKLSLFALIATSFVSASAFAQTADDLNNETISQEEERTYSIEQSDKSHYTKLLQKAGTEGKIRIIVGVKASFKPEGWHRSSEAVDNQRSGIATAQDALLKSVLIPDESTVKKFKYIPFIAMEVDEAALQNLMNNPMVNSIEEDELHKPLLYDTIPLIGADTGEADYSTGYTGQGQTIAILDTGVDKTHSFLSGRVVAEACFSSGGTSLCPNGQTSQIGSGAGSYCPSGTDVCKHGTHVAGIAAGKRTLCTDGTYCMRGVAPKANVIAIQVFHEVSGWAACDYEGSSCLHSNVDDYLLALEHVYELRSSYNISSVNMSLGSGKYPSNCDSYFPSIKAAIDQLKSVGIATVIASGNNGYTNDISKPACISSAVSVGTTNMFLGTEEVSDYSNSASFLSLLAPGGYCGLGCIFGSLGLTGIYSSVPGNSWGKMSGTSMAAPHVAGAWALMKEKNPSASVSTILSKLQTTGKSFTDSKNNITKKRIQVDKALAALSASCTYSISPTSKSFTSTGGTGSITVTPSSSSCTWTATESLDWVTITSGSSGTGSGTVSYSVSANTSTSSRSGNMTIAGQTFTITQSAHTCSYTISPTSKSFTSSAGTGSVTVTASSSSCTWTATESLSWVTITSGSSGTGSGTVSYSVSANTSTSSRSGNMTIAGQTFTITQAGEAQNNCAATVSSSLVVHIPVITYSGSNYWADLAYNSANGILSLTNAGVVNDMSPYSSCTASTLSSDYKLHIPVLMLDGTSYWADLQYNGSVFVISGGGQN